MTRQLTAAALCAKAIRTELKKEFPKTKFSVTSENFAGGNAVRIAWTDGPTGEQIEKYTNKYQYGHFDGMIDCYEYSNNRDDIPQAKYITTRRELAGETTRYFAEQIAKKVEVEVKDLGDKAPFEELYSNWYQIVWKFVRTRDLTDFKELTQDEIIPCVSDNNGKEVLWSVHWATKEELKQMMEVA